MVRYAPSDLLDLCPALPPPSLEVVDTTSIDVQVDAGRQPSPTMLQQLLDGSPRFRATWQRERTDFKDQSQSGYDLAIMHQTLVSGHSEQDAVDLAVAHRVAGGQPPKRHDYYVRTLAKARASAGALADGPKQVVSLSMPAWVPFPLGILPQPVRRIVEAGARSIGCDPANLALSALAVLGAAIGTTRRIQIKRGWCEYPILWTLLIGASGRMRKSPALAVITRPIAERQARELVKYERAMDEYLALKLKHDADVLQWKKDHKQHSNTEPPEAPKKPAAKRLFVADTTVEALAPILAENPRGVLLLRDELSGWLRGFNQYKSGGQGGDVPQWLEAHQGGMWMKDRRINREWVSVPRAAVSVTGTTQPGIAKACLNPEFYECGLVARLLMAQPPASVRTWSDDEISSIVAEDWANVVHQLHDLVAAGKGPEFGLQGSDDDQIAPAAGDPVDIPLSPEARARFARFVNEHGLRTAAAEDDVGSALAKLEGAAARLALIFQLADAACEPLGAANVSQIDLDHIERGIQAAEWFANETERVYQLLRQDEAAAARHALSERISALGGAVTPRDLIRHVSRIKTAEEARQALDDLVKHEMGRWEDRPPGPKGGRPSRVFVLCDPGDTPPIDSDRTDGTPGDPEVVSTSMPPPRRDVADLSPTMEAIQVAESDLEAAIRSGDQDRIGVARNRLAQLTTPESAAAVEQDIRRALARPHQ